MKLFRSILIAAFLLATFSLEAIASVPSVSAARSEQQRFKWKSSTIKIALSSSLTRPNSNIKTDSDVLGAVQRSLDAWQHAADVRFELVQTEKQSVVLKGVTFLPGSATLTADAQGVLDTAAAALAGQKDLKVEIGGHTDAQGSDAANQRLSQRRADSVRQYLVGKGIEGERLTAVGYGEAQPIADNGTPAGRAENRRVEFKIVQ